MQFNHITTYLAQAFGFTAISDGLALIEEAGYVRILAGSRDGNSVGLLALAPIAPLAVPGSPHVAVLPDLSALDVAIQTTSTRPRVFVFTEYTSALRGVQISATGTVSKTGKIATNLGDLGSVTAMEFVDFGSTDVALAVQRNISGLRLFQVADSGVMTLTGTLPDGPKSFLSVVSDMDQFTHGGDRMVLTSSAVENGLTLLRITPQGGAEVVDSFGVRDGLPISGPVALRIAQISGQTFAVVASTGSDSLTSVRINPMGVMFAADHIIDDRSTRFAGVAALDLFEVNGRLFVVAGGTDSGVTIVEMLPGGALSPVLVMSYEWGSGFPAVTGISAKPIGDKVVILLTQSNGTTIRHFEVPMADIGPLIFGAGGQVLGTAQEDRILGSALAETLQGGAGADFIHDGAGLDLLTGGAGADVFVLALDGQNDRITDYEPGLDRIDLSAWGRAYSASAYGFLATPTGAEITFGTQRLLVTSATGTSLAPSSFSDADFLF